MLQELIQGPQVPLFKIHRHLIEGLQVFLLRLSPRHSSIHAVQPGQQEAGLQEGREGFQPCLLAQDGQSFQKRRYLGHGACQQGLINISFFAAAAQLRQIIRGEAKHRACQHRQQGDILLGVGHRLQQGAESAHLLRVQKVHASFQGAADALGFQRTSEGIRHGAGRAEQDHDVLRRHRAKKLPLPHGGAGFQHFLDALRSKCRLLVVGVAVVDLKHIQLNGGIFQGNVGHPLPQSLRLAVFQFSHLLTHTGGEHIVDAGNHFPAGAEIVAEQDFPPLPRLCFLCRNKGAVFFQKNLGVSQAEAVDGLLHIPHQKAVVLFLGQGGEDGVLHLVGILVFIHHDLPEPGAELPGGGGDAGAAFPQEQIQGAVLQISKIQNPAAALDPAVFCVKLTHQINQSLSRRPGLAQIRQHLGRIIGKAPGVFFQRLLEGIPGGLHLVGKRRVTGFGGKAQGAEADVLSGMNLIPGFAAAQVFQLGNQLRNVLRRLFHTVSLLQPLQAEPKHLQFPVQPGKQLLHQVAAPEGLPGIGHPLQAGVFQAFIQPGLGIKMAAGAVVYL